MVLSSLKCLGGRRGGHGNTLFVLADQKSISRLLYVKLPHFSLMYFCSLEPHSQYIHEKLLIIIPEFRLVVKIGGPRVLPIAWPLWADLVDTLACEWARVWLRIIQIFLICN